MTHRFTAYHFTLTWLALLVLTVVTFLLTRVLGSPWELVAALLIATVKGGLVVAVFMHLLEQRFANKFVFAVALVYIVVLVVLVVADIATRAPVDVLAPAVTW